MRETIALVAAAGATAIFVAALYGLTWIDRRGSKAAKTAVTTILLLIFGFLISRIILEATA